MLKYKIEVIIFSLLLVIVCGVFGNVYKNTETNGIIISEVRSDYGNVLYDSNGSSHGFVELYNNSDRAVNLDGWYISDTKNNLLKYRIENCIIEAGEYIVFWSNDLLDVNGIMDDGRFLGYRLSEKEPILLSDAQGKIIDKVTIPDLDKGVSYLRDVDGYKWIKGNASPSLDNDLSQKYISVNMPKLSENSGFYDNTVTIKIKADKGCKIYYSTDGSTPTENSQLYTGPIVLGENSLNENIWSSIKTITLSLGAVPQTSIWVDKIIPDTPVPKINIIKAISVDKNGNKSPETTGTYIIGYKGKYGFDNYEFGFENPLIMSITTDPDNLFGYEKGIYVTGKVYDDFIKTIDSDDFSMYTAKTNYSSSGKGWRRPVNIELFSNNKLIASQKAAIAIHGNWSVIYNQKSFNLYSQPLDDSKEYLLQEVFEGQHESLMLRAGGFRDLYSTKFRDVLNQKLVKDTNILATEAIPCQVFINGEYWGLYNLQERIDESLVASHYNVNTENLIILKNRYVVAGEPEEIALYDEVLNFVEKNNLSSEKNYTKICEMIDIDSYIDYYIFQIYIANCDSVANNYSLWRTRTVVDNEYGDGRWRWILYDTDDSADMVIGMTEVDIDSFSSGHWSRNPMDDELFTSLIENEKFKLQFADRFIELSETVFDYENVESVINELMLTYVPATTVSHRRFINNEYPESKYYEEVDKVKEFFKNRYQYIYKHMVNNLDLEEYGY